MTTRLTSESSPRLPAPSNYTPYCERVAAQQEAFLRRRKRERWLLRACWASVALLGAVIAWRLWL